MDCVALLVVNMGRKRGALQQEVNDEVQIEEGTCREYTFNQGECVGARKPISRYFPFIPLNLPDAAFRMLAGNEECFGEERGALASLGCFMMGVEADNKCTGSSAEISLADLVSQARKSDRKKTGFLCLSHPCANFPWAT